MSAVRIPIFTWILLLIALLFGSPASAEEPLPVRRIGIRGVNNELLVSFSCRDAFTESVKKKLSSGLKTSVVIQLTLERQGSKRPLVYWVRTVEITYDLWEEKYYILREDNTGRRRARVSTKVDAVDLAGTLKQVAIGHIRDRRGGVYRVRAKIETNPVSKEMVQTIRTWLARSRAQKSGNIATSNYFGSFVGALVDRRISQAEHTIEFVSQWFKLRNR